MTAILEKIAFYWTYPFVLSLIHISLEAWSGLSFIFWAGLVALL